MDSDWIIPERLLLGSCDYTQKDLLDRNIDVVVCVAPNDEVPLIDLSRARSFPISFRQPDALSAKNMDAAKEACLATSNVSYLHCVQGFNRSAAVAVLVVEAFFRVSRHEAIEYVSSRRHVDTAKHLALYDRYHFATD